MTSETKNVDLSEQQSRQGGRKEEEAMPQLKLRGSKKCGAD